MTKFFEKQVCSRSTFTFHNSCYFDSKWEWFDKRKYCYSLVVEVTYANRYDKMNMKKCWITLYLNKAGYTATLVACGWAGAVFELLKHLARSSEAKDRKNIKKIKWGLTNRPTDRRKKRGIESRSTRLKIKILKNMYNLYAITNWNKLLLWYYKKLS